jgi:hypothetical protein
MTHTILVKLAPIVDTEAVRNPASIRPGRTLYQRGALELLPGAKVLIDHDHGRVIGRVRELSELRDTDGPWLAALCDLSHPPVWIERGTRASFEVAPLLDQQLGQGRRVCRGLLTEVSILPANVEPAEPRASVVTIRNHDADGESAHRPTRAARRVVLRRPDIGTVIGVS